MVVCDGGAVSVLVFCGFDALVSVDGKICGGCGVDSVLRIDA
ncbi:hypothetical protein A2U01_0110017, partial [Trifolium medium]|nr:hypothetical protein [Trifolium medium]